MFKRAITTLAVIAVVAGQFAIVGTAEAKRPKCASVAVPGHPGTFVLTCSTKRP
jgi:hypothetical protein